MPKPEGVDLHLHSTASDGSWPPSAIIRQAVRVEVATLALTDHDSIGGIARAQEAARGTGVTVIPGVEVTAPFPGGECHLLVFSRLCPPRSSNRSWRIDGRPGGGGERKWWPGFPPWVVPCPREN